MLPALCQIKCLKFKVPKVPKVKVKKITITCFGPVFIGLKMGFPILSSFQAVIITQEGKISLLVTVHGFIGSRFKGSPKL